ncbi:hypothetical protein L1987_73608 [Smallanthus sonchifolius]|uniref:Uncharacterized protein n=1 Tax=Smallanthus sonchifolius TaxID=185202 RepID=A0ACB9A0H2_9ASTR|nr:hypothetical protein L1987_73608 [Smallanthus sonchifolius]
MGCVSSHLLNQDDDFTQISTSTLSQHIVSFTSTTYGLLTLDPSSSPTTIPPTPPPPFTLGSIFHSPEVINSWELMAGLDSTPETTFLEKDHTFQEKTNPNHKNPKFIKSLTFKPVSLDGFEELCPPTSFLEKEEKFQENANPNYKNPIFIKSLAYKPVFLDGFEELCPPKGENRVVIYTTTLRGVRKTFEACNAVRAVLEGFGVSFCERDISMDRGFREELWGLMKGKDKRELVPPRVFVKGRYVGGCVEVLKIVEEGCLGQLLDGLPKSKAGYVCDVCGGARFLPCVVCNGSCKMVVILKKGTDGNRLGKSVTVKCSDCNENGLKEEMTTFGYVGYSQTSGLTTGSSGNMGDFCLKRRSRITNEGGSFGEAVTSCNLLMALSCGSVFAKSRKF